MSNHARFISAMVLGAALATGAGLSSAQAQDATYLSKNASYCDIFRSISKVVPQECAQDGDFLAGSAQSKGMLTRSIVRRNANQPSSEQAVLQQDPPEELSIALKVQFALDSATLTPEAKQILDRVAQVFNNTIMTDTYIQIEGHADASGGANYNDELSTRRAVAVRSFLIERHGIDAKRLLAQGKGEHELYDPSNPYGGINRRVEFVNISG